MKTLSISGCRVAKVRMAPAWALALALCAPAVPATDTEQPWSPAMIDAPTRAITVTARRDFEHCVVERMEQLDDALKPHPRRATNTIINQCIDKLDAIAAAHRQIDVPEPFTDRFLMKIRTGMVRQLLPLMQHRAAAAQSD